MSVPDEVEITREIGEALAGADIVLGVVPSAHARAVYSSLLPHLDAKVRFAHSSSSVRPRGSNTIRWRG